MDDRPRKVYTIPGAVAGLALLFHIVVAVVIIIAPDTSYRNPVLRFYRKFVVLGPFFGESRIASSPHLLISQHNKNVWTAPVDQACLEVAHPEAGKNESVQRRSFERFLSTQLVDEKSERVPRALRELENYLRLRPVFSGADSLQITLVNRRVAGTAVHTDTLYQHKFRR